MSTDFPGGLDSLTNPVGSDYLDTVGVKHAKQHQDANDAIEALEAKVGVNNSGVSSSLTYKIDNHLDDDEDPHPQYQLLEEKGAVSGYASLNESGDVPVAQIPAGIPQGRIDGNSGVSATLEDDIADLQDQINDKLDESDKGATNGVAELVSGKVPIAQLPTGSSSSTVCIGNDSRLSDTRTPTNNTVTAAKIVDGTVTQAEMASGLRVPVTCTTATRPSSPSVGDFIYDTDEDGILAYTNSFLDWTKPWNMPWGVVDSTVTEELADQVLDDNDTVQGINGASFTISGVKNRRLKITGQVTLYAGTGAARTCELYIRDFATIIMATYPYLQIGFNSFTITTFATPSDDTKVYNLAAKPLVFGQDVTVVNTATAATVFSVEDVGPGIAPPTS